MQAYAMLVKLNLKHVSEHPGREKESQHDKEKEICSL